MPDIYDDSDEEFGSLLRWLQECDFRLVMVEGARGTGKSTLIQRLLDRTSMVFYKTWGERQKWERNTIQKELGLELPQATYFVLDFLRQVQYPQTILADRGNLSALAYQQDAWLFADTTRDARKRATHEYYVNLMREVHACYLYLSVDEDELLFRRRQRTEKDEHLLYSRPIEDARRVVMRDIYDYDQALDAMITAGLVEGFSCEIARGATCYGYVPRRKKDASEEA